MMRHSTWDSSNNNEFNLNLQYFSAKTVISPIVKVKVPYVFDFIKPQHNPMPNDKKTTR